MLIVCPSCATSYMVDPATLGPAGRTVRCARCKVSWFAGGGESFSEVVDDVGAGSEGHAAHVPGKEGRAGHAVPGSEDHAAHVPGKEGRAGHAVPGSESHAAHVPGKEGHATHAVTEAEGHAVRAEAPEQPPPAAAESKASRMADAEDDFGTESDLPISELPRGKAETAPLAVPEVVVDAPSLVPPTDHEPMSESAPEPPAPPIEEASSEDVESFAARRQRLQARRKQKRSSTRWTGIALILFALNVTVVGGREYVVRFVPQTASLFSAIGLPVNLRQLSFENVKISSETQDGVNVLIVQGMIVSTASKPVSVPRLRFAARDSAGQEIYKWTALPSRSILGPGERLEFRSRLASPPGDARNILVRFLSPQDVGGSEQ